MSIPQTPAPLSNILASKTYNAAWFSGSTIELQIQAAINAAAVDGALYVYVPTNMLPYNAAVVVFNTSIKMIAEGMNSGYYNIRAYGAAGNNIADDSSAINAALLAAALIGGTVEIPPGTYKTTTTLTFPALVSVFGHGGQISIIAPVDCDGVSFANTADIASVNIHDFGIVGTSCTTRIALKSIGSANSADWTSGVHIYRLRITDFQTAMRFRNLHRSTVKECWFQRINIGINHSGQNMVNWFVNNWMIFNGGCGAGIKTGIIIDSANDYNPGGVTVLRPESVHVTKNFIFGFDTAIDIVFATLVNILNNDLESIITGIRVQTVDGVLNIRDNYVEVDGATGLRGLHFVPLSGVIESLYNVEGNKFIASANTNGFGTEIGTFATGGNQSNISLKNNTFSGWALFDISAYASGDIEIQNNRCLSNISTSIMIRGSLTGRGYTIDGNRLAGNLNIPAANGPNAQFNIGYNRGLFSTRISGTISILNGATTATLNYSALVGATANFDTLANTGLKFQVRFGAPDKNIGAVYGSATATAVTINCGTASVGTTIVPFEIYVILSTL